MCVKCGFHLETGAKLTEYQAKIEDHDSAEAALRRADDRMKKAKEMDDRLQAAGMPPWMMAMMLFILASCMTVAVIAVNVSRRTKGNETTFNAIALMLMLAGIAFAAVAIGSSCIVLYRAFKESPKEGMFVLLIPFYVFYYAFTRFKAVGKVFIVCLLTTGVAGGLFQLAIMSKEGRL